MVSYSLLVAPPLRWGLDPVQGGRRGDNGDGGDDDACALVGCVLAASSRDIG